MSLHRSLVRQQPEIVYFGGLTPSGHVDEIDCPQVSQTHGVDHQCRTARVGRQLFGKVADNMTDTFTRAC
jgi:hypothetical protein